jgi:hypothetical protein
VSPSSGSKRLLWFIRVFFTEMAKITEDDMGYVALKLADLHKINGSHVALARLLRLILGVLTALPQPWPAEIQGKTKEVLVNMIKKHLRSHLGEPDVDLEPTPPEVVFVFNLAFNRGTLEKYLEEEKEASLVPQRDPRSTSISTFLSATVEPVGLFDGYPLGDAMKGRKPSDLKWLIGNDVIVVKLGVAKVAAATNADKILTEHQANTPGALFVVKNFEQIRQLQKIQERIPDHTDPEHVWCKRALGIYMYVSLRPSATLKESNQTLKDLLGRLRLLYCPTLEDLAVFVADLVHKNTKGVEEFDFTRVPARDLPAVYRQAWLAVFPHIRDKKAKKEGDD